MSGSTYHLQFFSPEVTIVAHTGPDTFDPFTGIDRRNFVGASEIGCVLGMNPWKSRYQLWAEKTGLIPPVEQNYKMMRGHAFEEGVAKLFTAQHPDWKCAFVDAILGNENLPGWCTATPDRVLVGKDREIALLECKTATYSDGWEDGDTPAHYVAQVQQQLLVTGLQRAFLACDTGDQLHVREIFADVHYHAMILDQGNAFWDHVAKGIPPELTGHEDEKAALLQTLKENKTEIKLDAWEPLFSKRQALKEAAERAEQEFRAVEAEIISLMEGCNVGTIGGKPAVKIHFIAAAAKIDREKMKAAGIWNTYATENKPKPQARFSY